MATKVFFSFLNHHKCLSQLFSASFEYLCYAPVTLSRIMMGNDTDVNIRSPAVSSLSYCSVLERVNSPDKYHGSQRFAKPIRMFQTV